VSELTTYELADGIAMIGMDDGKPNALSPAMLVELMDAFQRADDDGAAVVLHGRPGMFSAGFDLKIISAGGSETAEMVIAGFRLSERMLTYPRPVVIGCTGHAIAMAAFVLLSADYRIGARGSFKITANEVAIGLPMPRSAIEITRQRLAPTYFQRTLTNAEVYDPQSALEAGFLDALVDADDVVSAARAKAQEMLALNANAHAITKQRVREHAVEALRAAIASDSKDLGF
jgi:enoyl-CoA hydratase